MLKILGVPRLPPGDGLGTGKRGTVPKIWRAVPIFLARVNGVKVPGEKNALTRIDCFFFLERAYV